MRLRGITAGTVCAMGVWIGSTSTAFAQAQPAPAGEEQDPKILEARQRYQRGLQLFNEANYDAARVEFERAYQLAPSYKILYNIGLSYEQLGDYVAAQTTLQKYLEQGGTEITEERRNEVAKELAQLRPRIGRVTVRTNVDGADVMVDDICGTDALTATVNCGAVVGAQREYLMNPGRRRVTVRKDGYYPETQSITVAGSDRVEMTVTLKPLPKGYVEQKSNPYLLPMWIGWGVTAAGGITAIVTGVLAKNAADDVDNKKAQFGATRDDLDHAQSKMRTLTIGTDVILIGTGVAAAVSTYFTIRAIGWKGGESRETKIEVGLGRIAVDGKF